MKGLGQQPIPGEQRHPFAKYSMSGRFAAPQIVIIHGGQIIVNDRVSMDHLQRARERHQQLVLRAEEFAGRQG